MSKLVARYRVEGEAAFEPKSRRPKSTPNEIGSSSIELILNLRRDLTSAGLDAGPDTIRWHLQQRHQITVSRATIARHLAKAGLVTPEPGKKPKTSYRRFEAAMPNETWQTDFTHYRLTQPDGRPGADVEILPWLGYIAAKKLPPFQSRLGTWASRLRALHSSRTVRNDLAP